MILTISTTHAPATDLGFLLHKNPAKAQVFELSFGLAHVFYPEATESRCTAALLLEVDPVALVRKGGGRGDAFTLDQYVNDRPYAVVIPERGDRAGVRQCAGGAGARSGRSWRRRRSR